MTARVCATLHDKVKLIKEFEESGMSKAAFAKKYQIPRTSLSDILASKEKLYDSLLTFNGSKRKRLRKSNFEDIEAALFKWVNDVKTKNIPLTGIILKTKAIEIAKEFGNHKFSGSSGWLERFKDRHGLTFKKISDNTMDFWLQYLALLPSGESSEKIGGDSSSVIFVSGEEWKNSFLKYILNHYQPSDIYNLGEMRLLYSFLPDIDSEHTQNIKDQIAVVLGVNMTGTDKLEPLVIGEYDKPECYKNVNTQSLYVRYKFNSKSCMSSELWVETIKELDKKFEKQNRKVAVILNISSHPVEVKELKAIEIISLPPNVTSALQPLNEDIILNFKNNYRKFLIKDWIDVIDYNYIFRPTIVDAIGYVCKSWKNVSAKTIRNCFRKAEFLVEDYMPEADEETDIEKNISLAELFQELRKRGKTLQIDENSYLNIDNTSTSNHKKVFKASEESKNVNSVIKRNDEIPENVNSVIKRNDEIPENNSVEFSVKPPSKKDALRSYDIIKNYLLSIKETTLKDHECLHQIEQRIINSCSENNLTT